ncbi:MAG: hypothetical protein HJJLKODD_01987 [Phycisphaerae bacterium]|nr:hypothetical protein [Phycisphaerae bacterium]
MAIKVPRYQPSRTVRRFKQRLLLFILVAMTGVIGGVVSFPAAKTWYYLRQLHRGTRPEQIAALNQLAPMALANPGLPPDLEAGLIQLLPHATLAEETLLIQIGHWLVHHLPEMVTRLDQRLDEADDELFSDLVAILQESPGWRMKDQLPARQARQLLIRSRSDDPAIRIAALQQMSRLGPMLESWITDRVIVLLADADPQVRLAAVETASICLTLQRDRLLYPVAENDENTEIQKEAMARLWLIKLPDTKLRDHRNKCFPTDYSEIIRDLSDNDHDLQINAIEDIVFDTLGWNLQWDYFQDLSPYVNKALSQKNYELAGWALWGLARLGDRESLPLMLEVAEGYRDQPMLRWMAARAAARLDTEAGGGALLNLLTSESDVVRDLAAIELAQLNDPEITRRLRSEFFAVERPARGAAALALALAGQGDEVVADELTLREWLMERTRLLTVNPHAEPDWLPRGYYLCAQLALGEEVRDELELFLINENFPRLAIYTALLHSGDSTPIDLLLEMTPVEQDRLLHDCFFAEIVQRYLPDAPLILWTSDPPTRTDEFKQLHRWWSIFRWTVHFNPNRHQWVTSI